MDTSLRIFSASAIGKGHIDGGLPCQDACEHTFRNSRLVAVVCDGAGSASSSAIGAKECATDVCEFLAALAGDPAAAGELPLIEQAIEAARVEIDRRALELGLPVRELACTLVGVVLFAEGGCLELTDGTTILSTPENGEYANETYFVTNEDWRAHLRITPFTGQIRCLALMSDGAMPFVINREKTDLFGPFIEPVKSYLTTVSESEGSDALQATLADERTWSITSDDKTLLLVLPL